MRTHIISFHLGEASRYTKGQVRYFLYQLFPLNIQCLSDFRTQSYLYLLVTNTLVSRKACVVLESPSSPQLTYHPLIRSGSFLRWSYPYLSVCEKIKQNKKLHLSLASFSISKPSVSSFPNSFPYKWHLHDVGTKNLKVLSTIRDYYHTLNLTKGDTRMGRTIVYIF